MEQSYYLLVFDSPHAAISAQRSLETALPLRVVPTLRQITASCGISLRVETADGEALKRALDGGAVSEDSCRLYQINGSGIRVLRKGGT